MQNIIIKEKLHANIKTALYSNFSNACEAIQEIIDNAVSHRIQGQKMEIKIFFIDKNPKKIEIQDLGGEGMNVADLNFFFDWGGSKQRKDWDIGQYGQGGKAAIGYLGNSFTLMTSPVGEKISYKVEDNNLSNVDSLKEYRVNSAPFNSESGYTSIRIGDLKINITDKLKEKIKSVLISTYRPLIEKGEVGIIIDGAKAKASSFPLDNGFKIDKKTIQILDEKKLDIWIGRLTSRSGLKGGMRCYYKGRLICDKEFFGHPDPSYKGTLNFLFGEVHLDFMPVNTNKTDFQRDSVEWEAVQKEMFSILQPHVDELLGRKIEEPTEEDVQRVKRARNLFQEILKQMNNRNEDSSFALQDEDYGQKPPEPRDIDLQKKELISKERKEYEPKTPPPLKKIGNRRRLRRFMDWDTRPMEETMRSKIEEREGGKILIINNMFPGYIKSKGNEFYLLETAALQTVPIEDTTLTPQKYLEEFDLFFGKICENLDSAKELLNKKKKKSANDNL